jgi:hypothetical protein
MKTLTLIDNGSETGPSKCGYEIFVDDTYIYGSWSGGWDGDHYEFQDIDIEDRRKQHDTHINVIVDLLENLSKSLEFELKYESINSQLIKDFE